MHFYFIVSNKVVIFTTQLNLNKMKNMKKILLILALLLGMFLFSCEKPVYDCYECYTYEHIIFYRDPSNPMGPGQVRNLISVEIFCNNEVKEENTHYGDTTIVYNGSLKMKVDTTIYCRLKIK